MAEHGVTKTPTHEVLHAIVYGKYGINTDALKKTWNELSTTMKGVKGMDAVFSHLENYDEPRQLPSEGITELLTQLVHGNIDIKDLPLLRQNKIIEVVNKLLKQIGVDFQFGNADDFQKFAQEVKNTFEGKGEEGLQKILSEKRTDKYHTDYERQLAQLEIDPEHVKKLRALLSIKLKMEVDSGRLSQEQANEYLKKAGVQPTEAKAKGAAVTMPKEEPKEEDVADEVDKLESGKPPHKGDEFALGTEVEEEGTGIRKEATDAIREKYGLSESKRDNPTHAELEAQAEAAIRKGYNPETLVAQMERGITNNGVENFIAKKYLATLEAQYERDADPATLEKINRFTKATRQVGSLASESLSTRRGLVPTEDSRADFFINELDTNNGAPLTEQQNKTASEEYEKLKIARKKLDDDTKAFEEKVKALKAEKQIGSTTKGKSKPTTERKATLADERKDILKSISAKWKTAGKDKLSSDLPYRQQIAAIAPDVVKLGRNLFEDGVTRLEDVVNKIYDTIKSDVDITPQDIHDILAGEYKQTRPTKSEAAIAYETLRQKATLINKLEKAQSGQAPTEKKQRKKNQEIEAFKKELGLDKFEQLQALKNRTNENVEKALAQLNSGNFAPPKEKKIPLMEDKELQKQFPKEFNQVKNSINQYIDLKRQIALRRLKEMYEQKPLEEKTLDVFTKALNIPRTLMASFDYSAPLRQGIVASISHPIMAKQALKFMFQASASQHVYNRWLDAVHKDPRWEVAQKTGLGITDPESIHLRQAEEAFQGAPYAEKIPLVGLGVVASERAYIGYLNHLRWNMFNMYVTRFEDQGFTYENNKRLYEGISSLINSETGRGGMGLKPLEKAAPVMNWLLFASKLMASRMNMLGLTDIPNLAIRGATFGKYGIDYGFYTRLPRPLRIDAAKDMVRFIGVGVATLIIAKQLGADVETDPRSSDFGKIRHGNTRWDVWGGFQPYARVLTQFLTGERKSASSGKIQELTGKSFMGETRGTPILSFLRGKLAPIPGALFDQFFAGGRDVTGQPVSPLGELPKNLIPLLFQDVYQAMQDQGVKAIFTVGVPSAFGVGVQTYQPRLIKNPHERRARGVRKVTTE
jgi:hypothetical protein